MASGNPAEMIQIIDGMQWQVKVETMRSYSDMKTHIKVSDYINGHLSSVITAFHEFEHPDVISSYVESVVEAFNQIRLITKKGQLC